MFSWLREISPETQRCDRFGSEHTPISLHQYPRGASKHVLSAKRRNTTPFFCAISLQTQVWEDLWKDRQTERARHTGPMWRGFVLGASTCLGLPCQSLPVGQHQTSEVGPTGHHGGRSVPKSESCPAAKQPQRNGAGSAVQSRSCVESSSRVYWSVDLYGGVCKQIAAANWDEPLVGVEPQPATGSYRRGAE